MVKNFLSQNRNVLLLVLLILLVAAIFIVRAALPDTPAAGKTGQTTPLPQKTQSVTPSAPAETPPSPAETQPPAEEQTPPEQAPEEPARIYDPRAEELLASMTLREKVYQMFLVTPEGLTGVSNVTVAGETTRQALEANPVGGLIYFSGNILNSRQLTELVANTQSYSAVPLFIAVDEEGGTVSRLGSNRNLPETTRFGNMAEYGAAGDTQAVFDVGAAIAGDLLHFGFNLNFAPVADVLTDPGNEVIGSRAFSSDPQVCADMVSAFVRGSQEAGVITTLKHFPGHGGTQGDTHNGMVVLNDTLDQLQANEFISFGAGIEAGAELVMVAHICAEAIDPETPASLSAPVITDLLRGQLGFDGVVVTDSLSMGAITDHYTAGQAAVAAVKAGADLLLMPTDLQEAAEAVVAEVLEGGIDPDAIDASVLRILDLKYRYNIIS